MNRNCITYWLPRLQSAGVPVPRTEIVRAPHDLSLLLDGELPAGWGTFLADLIVARHRIGGPVFLRTGQGAGKHRWQDTCFVTEKAELPKHVAALVEWSALVDIMGLPTDVWAVREMLPVEPVATLPRYGDMPLVKEVRVFVRDGKILCSHSYWPERSIVEGLSCGHEQPLTGSVLSLLSEPGPCPHCAADANYLSLMIAITPLDEVAYRPIAQRVADAFAGDGGWSVDLLATRSGWFCTDMAEMERSFHWPGCPHARTEHA